MPPLIPVTKARVFLSYSEETREQMLSDIVPILSDRFEVTTGELDTEDDSPDWAPDHEIFRNIDRARVFIVHADAGANCAYEMGRSNGMKFVYNPSRVVSHWWQEQAAIVHSTEELEEALKAIFTL